jgi:urease beta subunit
MRPIDVKAHFHFLLPVSLLYELRFLQNDATGMAQQVAWAAG